MCNWHLAILICANVTSRNRDESQMRFVALLPLMVEINVLPICKWHKTTIESMHKFCQEKTYLTSQS